MSRALTLFNKGMAAILNLLLILVVAALVLSITWGVLTRSIATAAVWISQKTGWEPWSWLPEGQAFWTEELALFLLVWVTLLGGAVAFQTKGHLGVDYFVGKLHPDVRRWVAVFSHFVVLFFAVAIFVWGGWSVVTHALAVEQTTPAMGWKAGHVYLALPIAGFFMVLFTIENIIETIRGVETTSESVSDLQDTQSEGASH